MRPFGKMKTAEQILQEEAERKARRKTRQEVRAMLEATTFTPEEERYIRRLGLSALVSDTAAGHPEYTKEVLLTKTLGFLHRELDRVLSRHE